MGRVDPRSVSPRQWNALVARDSHCQFPGCRVDVTRCHPHHVREWEDYGPTDLDNLILLCARHHRFVHNRHWRITATPGVSSYENGFGRSGHRIDEPGPEDGQARFQPPHYPAAPAVARSCPRTLACRGPARRLPRVVRVSAGLEPVGWVLTWRRVAVCCAVPVGGTTRRRCRRRRGPGGGRSRARRAGSGPCRRRGRRCSSRTRRRSASSRPTPSVPGAAGW